MAKISSRRARRFTNANMEGDSRNDGRIKDPKADMNESGPPLTSGLLIGNPNANLRGDTFSVPA